MQKLCATTALGLRAAASASTDPTLQRQAVLAKLTASIKVILPKVAKTFTNLLLDHLSRRLGELQQRLGGVVTKATARQTRNYNFNLTVFKKFGVQLADRECQKLDIQETNAQLVAAGKQLEQLLDPDEVSQRTRISGSGNSVELVNFST